MPISKLSVFTVAFILALPFYTFAAHAKTFHLKNGDQISGTVAMTTPAGEIHLQTPYGIVILPTQDIKTPAQKTIATPIAPAAWLGKTAAISKNKSAIEWSGNANIGASLQTGNSETNSVNGDAKLTAKYGKHRNTVQLEFNRAKDEGTLTTDNRSLTLSYDYFFTKGWFTNTSLSFEQDQIAALDLRSTGSLGLGHQVYEDDHLNLQYTIGPAYLHESFENGNRNSSLTAKWSLGYDQKLFSGAFQIFHDQKLLIPADNAKDFLLDTSSGLRIPLRESLIGTLQIDFDWDNEPAIGTEENDTVYTLKLGYEW